MRKKYLFVAAAAAMLAACSSNDALESAQNPGTTQPALEEGAIGFDAYTNRSVTRAGNSGVITTDILKKIASDDEIKAGYKEGFGVFAYYTDNNDYDPLSVPNFMYNQQVKHDGSQWTYEPLKYWPNEYGDKAISDDQDKVSFFAYAPYVEVTPSTGKIICSSDSAKWGIAGLTRNSATGDPIVKYIASFDSQKSVDLLWGVCDQPKEWPITNTGEDQKPYINDGEQGLPWLNVQRPAQIDQRLKFTFKHALAQLNVNIDTYADKENETNDPDKQTKVYVRSISFTGIASKGSLNLNNIESDKALWLDYNGLADLESGEAVTVYDGRKDGKEGVQNATASNEKTLGFNPILISDDGNTQEGVTGTTRNLFVGDDPIYIIPTGEEIEVEIVYDVETKDNNLSTYLSDRKTLGSSIENRIRKSVSFGGNDTFENGKHYTINLHLGLNSVKLDAAVSDWVEAEASADVDLPLNVPAFAAAESAAAQTIELPAILSAYDFAVTGLNGGEAVTTTPDNNVVTALSALATNSSGQAIIKATITPNKTVKNVTTNNAIQVKGNVSGKGVKLNLTQLAHDLNLKAKEISDDKKTITLESEDATVTWGSDINEIKVVKNGVELTKTESDPTAGQFKLDNDKVVLGEAVNPADVYSITVQAGDAYPETINVKIGGISYATQSVNLEYGQTGFINPLTKAGVSSVSYSGSSAIASIDAATGEITILGAHKTASKTITFTATASEMEDGYVSTTSGKTATYQLHVNKAAGTISAENITIPVSEAYTFELLSQVVLKNSLGDVLEAGSGATNKAGLISVTAVSDTRLGSNANNHVKLSDDGTKLVKNATYGNYAPQAGDVYSITVKVDATGNQNVAYATSEVTYTITLE